VRTGTEEYNQGAKEFVMQQIIISGVGGQGILFITKLLAETAMQLGFSILISETHGMAQRGGNVISHLKVSKPASVTSESAESPLTSPLIRPGRADLLLALHSDGEALHGYYLKVGGATVSNRADAATPDCVDANRIASDLGSPVSANLVLLGFAAARNVLFCSTEQLRSTLERLGGKQLDSSLKAFQAGCEAAVQSPRGTAQPVTQSLAT
jgi:indolepyruvate ferredoxin oxidoreductase, beta subunit